MGGVCGGAIGGGGVERGIGRVVYMGEMVLGLIIGSVLGFGACVVAVVAVVVAQGKRPLRGSYRWDSGMADGVVDFGNGVHEQRVGGSDVESV